MGLEVLNDEVTTKPHKMLFLKAFFSRIIKDLRQKELLPLKLLFFVHASTVFVLYPYLTIHMRELGINVEETAIMSAVIPFVAIIMPPLAGMVADRIGNFRILLAIFSVLGGASSLLLLLVPVGRITVIYPEKLIVDVGCNQRGLLEFGITGNEPCSYVKHFHKGQMHQVSTNLEACGFLCHPDIGGQITPLLSQFSEERNKSDLLSYANNFEVIVTSNITNTFSYSLPPQKQEELKINGDSDKRNKRILKNNEHYLTTIRVISNDSIFFPTSGLYNLSCVFMNDTFPKKYQCKFGENIGLEEDSIIKHFKSSLHSSGEISRFTASALSITKENISAMCEDTYSQMGQRVSVSIPMGERIVQLSHCSPHCLATVPRKQICSNLKEEQEYDISLTFWTYLVIRVFIGMISGTAFAMFEGAVIAILREQNADYGLQRIYATIGGMISSPLSGLLIDFASRGKGYTDFRQVIFFKLPAFYLYAALKIASGILMLTINLEFKAPATNVVSDVMTVLKNIEIVALFVAIFILGTAWGYIESFLFWLLQDLGGSRSLMGITITVGGIAGIPLLVLSGPIIDRIGHANVLFIGFVFYAIRLLAVTYAAKLSTTTTDTSIQGLLGGMYFGVGKGAGSLFGGYMMKAFGTRPTYQIFSGTCIITGIIYFFFNKFYLRKRPQVEGNDIVKKKPKSTDVQINLTDIQNEKESKNISNNNPDALKIAEKNKKNTESTKDSSGTVESETCNDNMAYVAEQEPTTNSVSTSEQAETEESDKGKKETKVGD
ncbi:hypothetical protein C0J52_09851 [Blattella germanica]|nr:hypothetical protein C0J52_09851 [Blattella germanica]